DFHDWRDNEFPDDPRGYTFHNQGVKVWEAEEPTQRANESPGLRSPGPIVDSEAQQSQSPPTHAPKGRPGQTATQSSSSTSKNIKDVSLQRPCSFRRL
ncbi:hypothetical protein V5O48_019706, partial [Marasmius crinis-equi]